MKKKDIEKTFARYGAADMPEIDVERIAATAVIDVKPKKVGAPARRRAFAAALATVLVLVVAGGAGLFGWLYGVDETEVYIDVNPSLKLIVTPGGTVKELVCLNKDAEALFGDYNAANKSVEVTSEYVFDTLYANGYLGDDAEVYVGATGKNAKKNGKAMNKVKAAAEKCIGKHNGNGKVYCDGTGSSNGNGNGNVSPMKQSLISQIIAYPENTYGEEELADMSVKELRAVLAELQK